jgi:enamine deaminase RidA (YjgF/YER057c/UK114 family)
MVYVSSIGPVDPETGEVVSGELKLQARQCMTNLKATLEANGATIEDIVWANWSLRDGADFDAFYEEWLRWFPDEAPVGQGTLMPMLQRRAGFRVSLGVIASTSEVPLIESNVSARQPVAMDVQRRGEAAVPGSPIEPESTEATEATELTEPEPATASSAPSDS